jgi:hypothetical protein
VGAATAEEAVLVFAALAGNPLVVATAEEFPSGDSEGVAGAPGARKRLVLWSAVARRGVASTDPADPSRASGFGSGAKSESAAWDRIGTKRIARAQRLAGTLKYGIFMVLEQESAGISGVF